MAEKSLKELEPKKESPKETSYPKWQGIDKAEIGVTYIKDNGNLIKKGNKPL
jgi:hypothetical protein|tara:strand:- start:844 stop:999 length:156 start_codon:yes stop_codon:yes gene_type:complete